MRSSSLKRYFEQNVQNFDRKFKILSEIFEIMTKMPDILIEFLTEKKIKITLIKGPKSQNKLQNKEEKYLNIKTHILSAFKFEKNGR